METETLQLNYRVNYKQFHKIWFDYFKKSLPNLLAFWGTAVLLCLLGGYFFTEKLFFGAILFVLVLIPIFLTFSSYQSFTRAARENFLTLSEEEKNVEMLFKRGADGFDCRAGKSFSHIAWDSIKGVNEFSDCFVFNRAGNMFYLPKEAFHRESDVKFLRFLITTNVKTKVKLLE